MITWTSESLSLEMRKYFLACVAAESPPRVKELARLLHLSPWSLSRLARRLLGCTPAEYLRRLRNYYADRLLERTGLTTTQIAYRGAFARAFTCGGEGTAAEIYAVLDWIPIDPNRLDSSGFISPRVVNMSFELLIYEEGVSTLDAILEEYTTFDPPIVTVAAAGNGGGDSWWSRPAQSPGVIAVGGLNWADDTQWVHSNHRVDLYAPAQFVEAASYVFDYVADRYRVRSELDNNICPNDGCTSGTSFASPIVAGVAARFLENRPGLTAAQVQDYIVGESLRTKGACAGPPLHRDPVLNYSPSGVSYPCH